MSSDESVWYYVKHDDGDVQRLSLEQLDAAFQAGFIDADTRVLASNQTQWTKLGLLAGLDETPPTPTPTVPAVPSAMPVYAPVATAATVRAQAVRAPVMRAQAPAYAPIAQPYSPPPLPSSRPVSVDLGVLNDAGQSRGLSGDPFRSRSGRKKGWVAAVLGLAVAAGAGTVAVRQPSWAVAPLARLGIAASAQPHAEAAMVWNSTPTPPPAAAPEPAVVAPVPSSAPQATVSGMAPGITMGNADPHPTGDTDAKPPSRGDRGSRAPKSKPQRTRGAAARPVSHSSKKSTATFTTSGNKFDPLNSTIQ